MRSDSTPIDSHGLPLHITIVPFSVRKHCVLSVQHFRLIIRFLLFQMICSGNSINPCILKQHMRGCGALYPKKGGGIELCNWSVHPNGQLQSPPPLPLPPFVTRFYTPYRGYELMRCARRRAQHPATPGVLTYRSTLALCRNSRAAGHRVHLTI